MKRLAGYYPIAAFVSAGSLLVYFFLEEAGNAIATAAPSMLYVLQFVQVATLWLWAAGLVTVTISTDSASTLAVRVAAAVALIAPIPIGVAPLTPLGIALQAPSFLLLFLSAATMLLAYNLDARRAGRLHGALPWLGIGVGVAYAISAVLYFGILTPNVGMDVFMTGFNVNLAAEIAYMVWAIWTGVKLTRTKTAISPAPSPATV